MTSSSEADRRLAEAMRLSEEIDAWSCAVPFECGGEAITDDMRSNTKRLFDLAILISHWTRKTDVSDFLSQHARVFGELNAPRKSGYATSQRRNGCEVWQAFLTVAHYGRVVCSVRSNTVLITAMECARRCLWDRKTQAGFTPDDLSPAVVVQVAENDYMDDPFTRNCLQSLVARAKSSYSLALDAREVLVRTLRSIDEDFIGDGNRDRMQRVLDTVAQGIEDTDARVVAVVQGLHSRLGERSLVMGLGRDLVSRIVGVVKEG